MIKKRLIVSYENLASEVVEALNNKYPDGIENHVIKVDAGPTKQFYAVTIDYDETSYLVKINVSIDSNFNGFDDEEDENQEPDDTIEATDDDDANFVTGLDDEPSTEDDDVIG